jgi:hypothetical protein
VFNQDLSTIADGYLNLALVWQDNATQRWWPTDTEAGTDNVNLIIVGHEVSKSGVTYDSGTKKLTITLEDALETYSSFSSATDVNLVLACWWGVTDSINELGIVSANIVSGNRVITINPNVYDAGDGQGSVAHGYQAKVSLSELLGSSITVTTGDSFTLTYTFTSNVAIDSLQVVLADTRSAVDYWAELSGYEDIGAVTVGTPVSDTKPITATATAGDSSNDANQLVFNIGETSGAASAPTLTFTALTLVKN